MHPIDWLRARRPQPATPPLAPVAEPKPAEPPAPTPAPHVPSLREPEAPLNRHGHRRDLVDCGCIGRYSQCRCPKRAR